MSIHIASSFFSSLLDGDASNATVEDPNDGVSVGNDAGDWLLMSVMVQNATVTTPAGWTLLGSYTGDTARRLFLFTKQASVADEEPPLITQSNSTAMIVGWTVVRTNYVGNPFRLAYLNVNSSSKNCTWAADTASANSTVLFIGASAANTSFLESADQLALTEAVAINNSSGTGNGTNTMIIAKQFMPEAGATAAFSTQQTVGRVYVTAMIEVMDSATDPRRDVYLKQNPGKSIEPLLSFDASGSTNFTAFFDVVAPKIAAQGVAFDADHAGETTITFNAADVASSTTVTVASLPSWMGPNIRRRMQVSLNGSTFGGLTDGGYYCVEYINETTVAFRVNPTSGRISLTAGTGTVTLRDVGLYNSIRNTSGVISPPGKNSYQNANWLCAVGQFDTPYDFTGTNLYFGKGVTSTNTINTQLFVAVDSSGEWRSWKILDNTAPKILNPYAQLVDIATNTTYYSQSTGSFDPTAVKFIAVCTKILARGSRPSCYFQGVSLANTIMVGGGDAIAPATYQSTYDLVNRYIQGTTANPSDLQFVLNHSLQFGDGVNPVYFDAATKSLAFPPLADGETSFDAYLASLGVIVNVPDGSTVYSKNCQIGATAPFDLITDAVSSDSADVSFEGSTFVQGTVTLQPWDVRRNNTWVGGRGLIFNGALIDNCVIDASRRASGSFILDAANNILSLTIKNCQNGLEIDTHGTYDVSKIGFSGNDNDINITATTGTVTLLVTTYVPSYVTAGATVVIDQPQVALTITGVLPGSDIVILEAGTETELADVQDIAGTSYSYTYQSLQNIDIGVFKVGYVPLFVRDYALSGVSSSLPVKQVADRNFS